MSYNVKDFRGEAAPSFRITNAQNAGEIIQFLKDCLPGSFAKQGIPAQVREDTAKSGGLFGSQVPMLVISHPNPPYHYFDIGIVVNGSILSFPLLGYSEQNTRANKKEAATGLLKSLLTPSADEFALQQEHLWEHEVVDAIMSNMTMK